jgi:chitinase
VDVLVVGDVSDESSEVFYVDISSTDVGIADSRGAGTITNDDSPPPAPMASINDVTVTEGNSGTTTASFTVSISPPASQPVAVSWTTADGTAVAPGDYQSGAGTLSFASGEASKTVDVLVVGDVSDESSEVYYVDISSTDVGISDSRGAGTITNDDTQSLPSISISDVTMAEGNGGSQAAVFVVTLSAPSANQVTVGYATADGKARTPSDYQGVTGSLVYAPGEVSKTISVTVYGDTLSEREENFFVNLSGASGATIADAQGKCLIQNDDG